MRKFLARFASEEGGTAAIEYGLVASLVSVAVLASLLLLGLALQDEIGAIAAAIAEAG